MRISPKKYAVAFCEAVWDAKEKDKSAIIDNFVKLLTKNNVLSSAGRIMTEIEKYWQEKEGQTPVNLVISRPLSEKFFHDIKEQLSDKLKREVVLESKEDEKLLGGLILRFDDILLDGSVRGQLDNLHNKLL
ncbi:MAG: ATP synthase F1 subunit delta [Candidatus Pacebacteria bacterium]|nr:ATP synthase F1 subunit delta [Candidatus Paceibacterota bacterium]